MWQLRFNKKKQSSLDSLNLGLRVAKNKPKWKEKKQTKKANKKADVKPYNGSKRYWMAWSFKHWKKRELQVMISLPLKKGPLYIVYIHWNTDLSKRGDGG